MMNLNPISNFFTNLVNGVTSFTDKVSTGFTGFFDSNAHTLESPDTLFVSTKRSNTPASMSFNGIMSDKNIIGRSEALAAERLKRVSVSQLKDAGARNKEEFFKLLLPAAKESERKYGVPAAVTLAQAALESGWGKSGIGGFNIFGIKGKGSAGTVNVPTKEFLNGKWVTINDNFAKYGNFYDAVMSHGKVFHGGYKGYNNGLSAYAKTGDPKAFIKAAGPTYATDPQYSKKIMDIMEANGLIDLAKNYYVEV
jgi:flagellum-specific peptidoglycan hydrolase FlgJ